MVHLIPSNDNETSVQTAHLLLTHVFRYHGFPTSIHSDRDSKLTSDFWSELCRRLHIKHRISSAYHPQSNGQAERTVQTTKQLLRIVTLLSQQDESDLHWLDALPAVEMAINNAPIASTPYSPYFLNYGFHPCLLADVLYPQHRPARHLNRNLLTHFTTMTDALRITSEALLRLQKQQAKQANKHRTDFTFKIGDLVLVRPHEAQRHAYGIAGTLSPHAQGPYKITAQINPTTFQIELPPGSKLHPSYHVSRLFPYRQFSPAISDIPNDSIPPEQIISDDAEVPLSQPITNPFDPDFSESLTGQEDPDFWRPVFQPKSGSSSDHITGQEEVDFWRPVFQPPSGSNQLPMTPIRTSLQVQPSFSTNPSLDWDEDESDMIQLSSIQKPKRVHFKLPAIIIPSRSSGDPLDSFTPEDVKLDPLIYQRAKRELKFKPSADMFASYKHHQLPRYYSRIKDPQAVGIDSFRFDWNMEPTPYINPPWSLIPKVLRKLQHDQVRAMMVVPYWPNSSWYPTFHKLVERSIKITDPLYLDDSNRLRPAPSWPTIIAIVNGTHLPRTYT